MPTLTVIPLYDVLGRTLHQVLNSTVIKTFVEMVTRRISVSLEKNYTCVAVFKLRSRDGLSLKSL